MDIAIRVTRNYSDVVDWVNNIECEQIVVYEHTADEEVSRTHIHMLVVGSKCKPDALKARYKKLYGVIESKDWSFKSASEYERYITYMTKGTLLPVFVKGFEEDYITKLMLSWQEPKTNVKLENGKFVRDVNVPGQKTKIELLEQMRSELCDGDSTRAILKVIRKVLIANKCVLGQYKMLDYYDSLMMYSRKEDWISGMERKINSRSGI